MTIRILPLLPLVWLVLEIVTLVEVGRAIGALGVVALLFLAGILGAALIRFASAKAAATLFGGTRRGLPLLGLRDAGWQVAAGVLLIVPGFLSDVLALALFVPPVRRALGRLLPQAPRGTAGSAARVTIIEGEAEEVSPRDPPRPPLDRG